MYANMLDCKNVSMPVYIGHQSRATLGQANVELAESLVLDS
jgi:hypothetical protein